MRRRGGDKDTGGNSKGGGTDNNQQSTKSGGGNGNNNVDNDTLYSSLALKFFSVQNFSTMYHLQRTCYKWELRFLYEKGIVEFPASLIQSAGIFYHAV